MDENLTDFAKSIAGAIPRTYSGLLRENEALRAELEELYGQNVYPFSDYSEPCRKCGQLSSQMVYEGKDLVSKLVAEGPTKIFEPAVQKRWWRPWAKATPERMRCKCPICKAVYYEQVNVKAVKTKRVRKSVRDA